MLETAVAKPSNPPARHTSRGRRRALRGRRAKARRLRRSALADASGFTLAEVLVALVLMSVVLTAILGLLEQSSRVANSDVERDASLNEQTSAFFRMIDELRQAYQVNCPSGGCSNEATSSSIDFDERITSAGQKDRRVAYNCGVAQPGGSGWNECVRYETAATDVADAVPLGSSCSSCTSTVVIQRVVNSPVFTKLTTDTSASGAVRWNAGTVTIYTPTGGAFNGGALRYKSDVILTERFYMPQLDFGL